MDDGSTNSKSSGGSGDLTTSPAQKRRKLAPQWLVGQRAKLPKGKTETYLDSSNIVKPARKADYERIADFTGYDLDKCVVFNLEREALHQTIIELTVRIKIRDATVLATMVKTVYAKVIEKLRREPLADAPERKNVEIKMKNKFKHDNMVEKLTNDILSRNKGDDDDKFIIAVAAEFGRQTRSAYEQHTRKLACGIIDSILEFKRAHKVNPTMDTSMFAEFVHLKFEELPQMKGFERCAWVISGGPASGKGHVAQALQFEYKTSVENLIKVNADYYKETLLERSNLDMESQVYHAAMSHAESSIIVRKIKERLHDMLSLQQGQNTPNLMLDVVKPSTTNMDIAGCGGATVVLKIVSCPAHIAVARAYDRGQSGNEKGRFVPPKVTLQGHKDVSANLPDAIARYNVFLEIYNTDVPSGASPKLIADIASLDKQIKVYYFIDMIRFIGKAKINVDARDDDGIYPSPLTMKDYVELIKGYVSQGISFLFFSGHFHPRPYATLSKFGLTILDLGALIGEIGDLDEASSFVIEFVKAAIVSRQTETCCIHERLGGAKIFVADIPANCSNISCFHYGNEELQLPYRQFFERLKTGINAIELPSTVHSGTDRTRSGSPRK